MDGKEMSEQTNDWVRITYNGDHDVWDVRLGLIYMFSTHTEEQAEFASGWVMELMQRTQLIGTDVGGNYYAAMQAHSAKLLFLALKDNNNNQSHAAAALNMPRTTFISKAQEDGVLPKTQNGRESAGDSAGSKKGGAGSG
jgi:DNA-binding protein Fis